MDSLGLDALCPPDNGNASTAPEKTAAVDTGEPPIPNADNSKKNLTSEERMALINDRAEANADRRLQEREQATRGANYREKHGAQTTIESQQERATTGRNPTTGNIDMKRNGEPNIPPSATRYYSARDQLNAINRAELIFRLTGDNRAAAQKPVDWGKNIGEGYQRGTLDYGVQRSTQTYFDTITGKAITSFPKYGE